MIFIEIDLAVVIANIQIDKNSMNLLHARGSKKQRVD